jgi:Uma2 family endonuclease
MSDRFFSTLTYNQVPYCWLVDPVAKTLEAFKLEREQWILQASFVGEADVAIEPFDSVAGAVG